MRKEPLFAALCLALCLLTACGGVAETGAGTEGDAETGMEMEMENKRLPHHDAAEDLLILVDFQNVYLPGEAWACPTVRESMSNALKVIQSPHAPDYVLTKFMPPENPVGRWAAYNEAYADINANEWLSEIADELRPVATDENVIEKSVYSSLDSERLQNLLAGKKRVVLTGVVAECCVLATLMDAIDLGYEAYYLDDCVSGVTPEYEESVRELARIFTPVHTQVMDSAEYLRIISPEA